jgi:excisionase family DNA binding protein
MFASSALPSFQTLLEAGGMKDKPRLTPEDVSAVTGAPISTVRRWLREGQLPALRTGSRYRWILAEDLKDFLSRQGGSRG